MNLGKPITFDDHESSPAIVAVGHGSYNLWFEVCVRKKNSYIEFAMSAQEASDLAKELLAHVKQFSKQGGSTG